MNALWILEEAWNLARKYFEGRLEQGTGKLRNPEELQNEFDFGLRLKGRNHDEIKCDMRAYLEKTTNTLGPHFQNQLFSGIDSHALAADWLATLTNTTMATFEVAPMATMMEKELIRHMNSHIGWKSGDGIMVTGGSNANLVAMLLARNLMFKETKAKGLNGMKLVLFVSEEAHYSWDKATNLMGLGLEQLRKVRSTDQGSMDVAHLKELIQSSKAAGEVPFFIGATAGTTVLGAYDPIPEIAAVAQDQNLWLHVDGAWGGSVLLSQKHKHLMRGVELADSVTWDTHKMLGTGLISSFILSRHPGSLLKSNHGGGEDYIFHETNHSGWDLGPQSLQCGRRNDAFKVWLMWRALGDEGLEKHVDHLFELARKSRDLITQYPQLELLYGPEMLNVCFRLRTKHDPNQLVRDVRQKVLREGNFFVNISNRRGQTFFRMITVNPHLTEKHLRTFFESIIRLAHT